jgi:Uma2 family endonuclease
MSPFDRPAGPDDLAALPNTVIGELVDGELYGSPRLSPELAVAGSALGILISPYQRTRDASPGWVLAYQPVLSLGADVVVPDWAGWRPDRVAQLPAGRADGVVAPDWVCEIVSPATAALDRVKKLAVYAREQVDYAWLVDPLARTIEVFRLEHTRWTIVAAHSGTGVVHIEPFETIDVSLRDLWVERPPGR